MQLAKHLAQGHLVYLSQEHDAISVSENDHYRWLAFGDVVQSVMNKRIPWQLTLPHQTAILLPLLFFRPEHVTELGLGGGNLDRFLCHLDGNIKVTSIEYNQRVIDCFEQYFNPESITIDTVNQEGISWLAQYEQLTSDWLICDIYKDEYQSFQNTIEQLQHISSKIAQHTCLSLNLPDASDSEVNLALTALQQLLPNHQLVYFHIPNYLNIIIHLCPQPWNIHSLVKHNKKSYLPKRLYKRWRTFWQHGVMV